MSCIALGQGAATRMRLFYPPAVAPYRIRKQTISISLKCILVQLVFLKM